MVCYRPSAPKRELNCEITEPEMTCYNYTLTMQDLMQNLTTFCSNTNFFSCLKWESLCTTMRFNGCCQYPNVSWQLQNLWFLKLENERCKPNGHRLGFLNSNRWQLSLKKKKRIFRQFSPQTNGEIPIRPYHLSISGFYAQLSTNIIYCIGLMSKVTPLKF